jgi:hypothetical protein
MDVTDFKVQLLEGRVKWNVPAGAAACHTSGAISKPGLRPGGGGSGCREHRVTGAAAHRPGYFFVSC